jgi:hypothetical protein
VISRETFSVSPFQPTTTTTTIVIIANKELLTYGLQFAGHPAWINETLIKLNQEHFWSTYGIGPDSLLSVINDLQFPKVLGNQRIKMVNIQELFTVGHLAAVMFWSCFGLVSVLFRSCFGEYGQQSTNTIGTPFAK